MTFPSESGSVIHGWFSLSQKRRRRAATAGRRREPTRHGEPRQISSRFGLLGLAHRFPSDGRESGDVITFGWRERFDVLAAVHFLTGGYLVNR